MTWFYILLILNAVRSIDFGVATSAAQIEGGWLEDHKSMTVWDNLGHTLGYVRDRTNADVTDDSYHRYHEDLALMKEYNIKHYRLSIPWTRVVPRAVAGSPVNYRAVEYYRKLLLAMKEQGIVAYINLFHNDLPAILVINGTGLSDREFPDHFAYYADVCFENLGDLVQFWFTFDEPWCQSVYDNLQVYDANTKPYMMGHNILLAHGRVAKIYREKYQSKHKGKIGLNLNIEMMWPLNATDKDDIEAARRGLIFQVDWFADPVFKGDYPSLMKQRLGRRLPQFTEEEKAMLKGSVDFFACNHYMSYMVKDGGHKENVTYFDDVNKTNVYKREWKRNDMGWPIVPEGMYHSLKYIYEKWVKDRPMEIWVTENGMPVREPTLENALHDKDRVDYMQSYLSHLAKAVEEGVPVAKYFGWSLMDNFEWTQGLSKKFGLVRVEYSNGQKRTPKSSMNWYALLIKDFA
eukprot:TRINITY_DN3627_c0_g3_i2.p1 TRINITY_DN3627_c0_g3~~TRINITY_DN3627_c0_g3_i2.p1  ORF type:complete len:462 (+),score=118.56 TRINITY_DN3627_c0_g3_i2:1188-2573(+)